MTQLNKASAGAPKRKPKAGSKAPAGAKTTKPKAKPKAKPAWDGFTSDLDRFKLPAEEQERRRAARKSKHMPSTSAAPIGQDPYRQPAPVHEEALGDAARDEDAHQGPRMRAEPTYPLHKDPSLNVSGGRDQSKLGHLDYRSIAKILQSKVARKGLQARGEAEPSPEQDSPHCKEGVVDFEEEVRDFRKRRVQEQKDEADPYQSPPPPYRAEGNRGYPRALEEEFMGHTPPSGEKVDNALLEEDEEEAEADGEAEEEGEAEAASGRSDGRASRLGGSSGLGYELTLRPRQELARLGAQGTGGGGQSSSSGGGGGWEARMQAAEERLRELEGLPRQVESMKEEMAALRSENQALSSEFTEFMSHTTTVLTKLQAQFAQLLSSTSTSRAPPPATSSIAEDQPLTASQSQRSAAHQPAAGPPITEDANHAEADDRNPPVARQSGSVPAPSHRDSASIGSHGGSLPALPDPYRPKSRTSAAPLGPADEQAQLPSFSRLRGESRSAMTYGVTLSGGLPQAWPDPGLLQAAAAPPFAINKFVPAGGPIPASRPATGPGSVLSAAGPSGFMSYSGAMPASVSDRFHTAQNSLSLSQHAAAARST